MYSFNVRRVQGGYVVLYDSSDGQYIEYVVTSFAKVLKLLRSFDTENNPNTEENN